MIVVPCPACEKVVGFDEADAGTQVVCPYCREPFSIPAADGPLPDEIRLVDEAPQPDKPGELPILEEVPRQPEPVPEPAPSMIPNFDLGPPQPRLPDVTVPEPPIKMLEEVRPEPPGEEEAERRRRRRAAKRRREKRRSDEPARPQWLANLTRNRVIGAVALAVGGPMLLGTVLHHLTATASAWHGAVCCGDLFALGLCGVGVYLLVKG
jgi:hypothetical protein